MMARISLLKTAVEYYIKSEFKNVRIGYDRVETTCDVYRLRCHENHDDIHVLDMLNAFRGDVVHKVEKRETISCPESTFSILKQRIAMVESSGQRALAFGDEEHYDVVSKAEKMCGRLLKARHFILHGLITGRFIDVLHREVVDCIEAYDKVKLQSESRRRYEIRKRYIPIYYGEISPRYRRAHPPLERWLNRPSIH